MRLFPSTVCALLLALAGCQTPPAEREPELYLVTMPAATDAPLRVGISPYFPPFAFEAQGDYRGLEVELARELGRSLQREVDFQAMKWDELIPALEAGAIDIVMSGMSITKERLQHLAFTEPYLRVGKLALIRGADRAAYPHPESILLARARVGVNRGTTSEAFVRDYFPYAESVQFNSEFNAADALIREEVDLVIGDAPTIWWLAAVKKVHGLVALPEYLSIEFIGWAVDPENTELRQHANEVLRQWKSTGQLRDAVTRWMPDETTP